MLFLLLTILSSLVIALILKLNETRDGERLVVAGANYVVAGALGLLLSDGMDLGIGWGWGVAGAAIGLGFVGGFLFLMRSIRSLGIAIPTSIARLSMLVPIVGSIALFDERPGTVQAAGIAIGIAAFILLGISQRGVGAGGRLDAGSATLLLALFLTVGLDDFGMKVAQEARIDSAAFLFFVFASAAIFCWLAVIARRLQPSRADLMLGAMLGVPNYFSSYFLILALKRLPAGIVFPVISASGVVAVTLAGMLIWKETPNRTGLAGIVLAAVAVALLGLD